MGVSSASFCAAVLLLPDVPDAEPVAGRGRSCMPKPWAAGVVSMAWMLGGTQLRLWSCRQPSSSSVSGSKSGASSPAVSVIALSSSSVSPGSFPLASPAPIVPINGSPTPVTPPVALYLTRPTRRLARPESRARSVDQVRADHPRRQPHAQRTPRTERRPRRDGLPPNDEVALVGGEDGR